jgi:hypothetical protein
MHGNDIYRMKMKAQKPAKLNILSSSNPFIFLLTWDLEVSLTQKPDGQHLTHRSYTLAIWQPHPLKKLNNLTSAPLPLT